MLDRLYRLFTSLKLTVVLLGLGAVLVFWGTLAQVHLGLYKAQNEFFRSFFVYWQPTGSNLHIPIFPAGYTIGSLLLINLFAAHLRYYRHGWQKLGIVLIHLGVVLLLVGQFMTDMLARESSMHIRVGETSNYSEADRSYELAVVDKGNPDYDQVVAIPTHLLAKKNEIKRSELPFTIRAKEFFSNSQLSEKPAGGMVQVPATAGMGQNAWWIPLPHETATDRRDMPSAIVELTGPQGSLGGYLVSTFLARPQEITVNGRPYELSLRLERFYKPFSLHLIEFNHDVYMGTDIPKNFSSRVRLQRPDTGEDREVLIYMNNPLRYWGETYYQASFDTDDQGTVLQVVRNPGWLTPYFACVMVATGLIVQFLSHLIKFSKQRRTA